MQFIVPTKCTVLNICKYEGCIFDMFQYKCTIFREHKMPGLNPIISHYLQGSVVSPASFYTRHSINTWT